MMYTFFNFIPSQTAVKWALLLTAALTTGLFASTGSDAPSVSADEVMARLAAGNKAYVSGARTYKHLDRNRMTDIVKNGQHPLVTLVSCSDSRVPPEHIFDAGLGDIFIIRVAGNISGASEIGSVEYGVDHVGTPLLVVLGHSHCGAVTAVAKGEEVHGHIADLAAHIVPAVEEAKKTHGNNFSPELLDAAVKLNVWQSIDDLITKSPVIAGRVKSGKLKIVGARYDLNSGSVEWFGEHPRQKEILAGAPDSGASHSGGLLSKTSAALGVSLALMLLLAVIIYQMYYKEKAGAKKTRVGLRLKAGYLTVIAVMTLSAASIILISAWAHGSSGWIYIAAAALSGVVISLIFASMSASSVLTSFRKVINALREDKENVQSADE
jgi:carbonic anhydrase